MIHDAESSLSQFVTPVSEGDVVEIPRRPSDVLVRQDLSGLGLVWWEE